MDTELHLTCCLCLFVATSERGLESHIDAMHADIFKAINPTVVSVEPKLEPDVLYAQARLIPTWNPETLSYSEQVSNSFESHSKHQRSTAPRVEAVSQGSTTKVPTKRSRRSKNCVAANDSANQGTEYFQEPDGKVKSRRGRKSKASNASICDNSFGVQTTVAVEPSSVQQDVSVSGPESRQNENVIGRKRRQSTSTADNAKRKSVNGNSKF